MRDDKIGLAINYLEATEAFNYGKLKHFCEMLIEDVNCNSDKDPSSIISTINRRLRNKLIQRVKRTLV